MSVFAQIDTTYYDSNFKLINKTEAYHYYRITTYNEKENNYHLISYTKQGKPYIIGNLLSLSPEIKDGWFYYFNERMSVSKIDIYSSNKLMESKHNEEKTKYRIRRSAQGTAEVYKGPDYVNERMNILDVILQEFQYPPQAKKEGITGKVLVGFTIQPDSTITDIKLINTVYPSLDKEAMRLIGLAKWFPGSVNGVPVTTPFEFPISFKISDPRKAKNKE